MLQRSITNNIVLPIYRSSAPSQESGLHIVGRRVQVLVDAINDIRGMGVEHLVDLPQLVLVGDQSAGESTHNAAKKTQTDNWYRKIEPDGSSR